MAQLVGRDSSRKETTNNTENSSKAETPQKRCREGLLQKATSATAAQIAPTDQCLPNKRAMMTPATPQRHHSADSPIPAAKKISTTTLFRTDTTDAFAANDVIFWQSMSPQGTLNRVLRQKEPRIASDSSLQHSRGNNPNNGSTASLMQGIVQQIIASRNIDEADPESRTNSTAVDKSAELAAISPTKPPRVSGQNKAANRGLLELDNDADIPSAFFDAFSMDSLPSSIETTPLANRRRRAIPRPLTISKSERVVDKRQMLSTLLLSGPNSADSPSEIAPMDIATPDKQLEAIGTPLQISSSDNAPVDNNADSAVHRAPKTTLDFTPPSVQQTGTAANDSDIDNICLDDIDMDDLVGDLDQFDEELNDLLKDTEANDSSQSQMQEQRQLNRFNTPPESTNKRPFKNCEKCLTLLVTEGRYTSMQIHAPPNSTGARSQKVVRVYSQTAVCERIILLRDDWYSTPIGIGDFINIVGNIKPDSCGPNGEVIIDTLTSQFLLPVLHPDVLVSCTHLSDSFSCIRRAVLKDRIREISDGSPPTTVMLIGTLLHDLFQACALKNKWDDAMMAETIRIIIKDNIARLWECQIDETSVYQQIAECIPVYQAWAQDYIHRNARYGSQYKTHRDVGAGSTRNQHQALAPAEAKNVAISKILNMEENAWSPKFGLKGKIDLTVLAQYTAHGAIVEPFELKTGRNTENPSHRAQLILYTLLISDRYDLDVRSGLLYYPRSGEMVRVPRFDDELRGLISMRNTMAQHLLHSTNVLRPLPNMLGNEFVCNRCVFKPTCFIAHKALENGSANTAMVAEVQWEDQISHLSERHLQFIRLWMGLIDEEEADMVRYRAELWNMTSTYRELSTGRCLSGMKLDVDSFQDTNVLGSSSRYKMTFYPDNDSMANQNSQRSLQAGQLNVGDPIVVSSESGQYALAVGYLSEIEFNHVVVTIDRPVRGIPKRLEGFDSKSNQDFESIMEIRQRGSSNAHEETIIHPDVPQSAAMDTFRIDKDEMSNAVARVRANLMRMFVISGGHSRCRKLIVDLQHPTFVPLHEKMEEKIQKIQRERRLNSGQAMVLRKVLSANDYALVMGMPGTGKTTTIAELVDVLVSQGKSVLLTSYTHIAVDNILLKLQERNIPMIRLGNKAKVHPQIVKHMPCEANLVSVKQLDNYFRKAPIVATTCLGVSHPVFTLRKFDYCIVDEASQITLPICLGPLLEAEKFVLVGDHHQLPPLVRNTAARDRGLGTSLFKRLCEAHPPAVVRLEYQYRMNSDIQKLANNFIYDGHLRCGSLKVANKRIKYKVDPATVIIEKWPFSLPRADSSSKLGIPWVASALDPQHGAVFIDTDLIPGHESRIEGSDLVQNDIEVKIIKVLTSVLLECGIEGRQIGILSPYRTQLRQLEIEYGTNPEKDGEIPVIAQHVQETSNTSQANDNSSSPSPETAASAAYEQQLQSERKKHRAGIEIHTIDRYQGRDADVIILSLVRSNSSQAIGELLRDWHRINVAITRARYKLIVVGSQSTLVRSPLFAGMLKSLNDSNSVVKIPKNAPIPATITETASANAAALSAGATSDAGSQGRGTTKMAGSALLKKLPITSNIIAE
ncbi:DNA replication endonuclease-helicase Dna2 [Coemansia spiralis]|uniref:DNA replication ATP-dependent helicase/nuclease n=2 Tax=Coemansia TaxID=4863 RepID=A0A9W8G344_9FUNG|nr:DNA replication endonuclease-helicase Dna2 [Coemansia umbellata]KAJ2620373.1 DNA replication endonuclease-helicase Dna2 [Coemansia sp. RSA 1358]KAJ2670366.1 DNA replication endonuclease-helicase Dna2 [Coemansia spiralis]